MQVMTQGNVGAYHLTKRIDIATYQSPSQTRSSFELTRRAQMKSAYAVDKTITNFKLAGDTRCPLNATVAMGLFKQSIVLPADPPEENQHDQTAEWGHIDTFQNIVSPILPPF